jgi:hypothetical protein
MKTLALSAMVAFVTLASVVPVAQAGSYYSDDDNSGYEQSYRYKTYRHCWWKKVKWYDDYGYTHYKRVKVCEY